MTQAITLRLITRQAGGGEIVRTRRVETGEAMIGRAPECEIYLPDLAVDREHALLRVTGESRVSLQSLTGEPFLVNGEKTLDAEFDVVRATVVTFGEYDLLFGQGGEGDIAITVMRKEEEHPPTPSLFSLKAQVFGRRRMAWTFALTILALCLIVPIAGASYMRSLHIHPDRQWSTGPLSRAHAFLEKDCQACHQKAFVAVRDEACLSCHQARDAVEAAKLDTRLAAQGSPFDPLLIAEHAPHDRLRKATPLPPTIGGKVKAVFQFALNHPTDRCASCHLEHTTAPPDPSIPAKAEIVRPGRPTLVVVNDCASCHAQLKKRLPATRLIDTPDWGRHPDFRPLVTVGFDGPQPRLQRVALTPRPQEANGLVFSHRIHMDPTGGVARQGEVLGHAAGYGGALTCQSCHRPSGGGFKPLEMERDCGACHSLAFAQVGNELKTLRHHDMRDIAGVLRGATANNGPSVDPAVLRRAMAPGGLCVDCHTINASTGPLGGEIAPVHLADRVLPWGDFNHGVPAHAGQGAGAAACADCHKATGSDHASDLLLSGISTCVACHGKTPHETPAAASSQCASCHSFHQPGRAPETPQDRTLAATGLPAGVRPRGMPAF